MKSISALFDTLQEANSAINDLVSNGFSRDSISLVSSDARGEYKSYFDETGQYRGAATTSASAVTSPVIDPDIDAREREMSDNTMTTGEGAAAGAGIGATIGGIGGVLMGLGLLVIPGVGPALAAGALASGLIGAGIGGATGGLVGALVNAGVSEDEAHYYAEGLRRGGHLVVVSTSEDRQSLAQGILQRHNPTSMQERVADWRKEGWDRFNSDAV